MRSLHRVTLIVLAFVVFCGAGLVLPRGEPKPSVHAPSAPTSVSAASGYSSTAVWPDVSALASRLGAEETVGAISAELERVHSFVESIPVPAVVPWSGSSSVPDALGSRAPNAGGGGPHSDAWWQGVASCEQGGNNHPYYGYLSFMDGSAGGKSWDEQVAMGNDLLARAGREVGPWAEACVNAGYRASPSG